MRHPQDYFSHHLTRSDSTNWMTPGSTSKRLSLTPKERPANLYHQASKSMVNLVSNQRRDLSIIDEERKDKGNVTDTVLLVVTVEIDVLPEGSRLQRRRSLPTFTEATEPPPYPSLEIPAKFIPLVVAPRCTRCRHHLPPCCCHHQDLQKTVLCSKTNPHVVYQNLRLSQDDRLPDELISIHENDTVFLGTS